MITQEQAKEFINDKAKAALAKEASSWLEIMAEEIKREKGFVAFVCVGVYAASNNAKNHNDKVREFYPKESIKENLIDEVARPSGFRCFVSDDKYYPALTKELEQILSALKKEAGLI